MRVSPFSSVAIFAFAVACQSGPSGPTPPSNPGPSTAPTASTGQKSVEQKTQDIAFLASVAAAHEPARPVPTFAETQAALASPEHAELHAALTAAGFSDDEQATMVSLAAGYNSGQPWDPVHARAEDARAEWEDATQELRDGLDHVESQSGQQVDRQQLVRAVFPGLDQIRTAPP